MDVQSHSYSVAQVTQFMRNAAEDSSRVFYTEHAEERATEREIDRLEVLRLLRKAPVIEGPCFDNSKGNYKLTVQGMSSGRRITVVVAIQPVDPDTNSYIIVVTVI